MSTWGLLPGSVGCCRINTTRLRRDTPYGENSTNDVNHSLTPFLAYLLQEVFTKDGAADFRGLFVVPLVIAIVAALVLAIFFKPPAKAA